MTVTHTDADGVLWQRVGVCNGCGSCCLDDDPSISNSMFTGTERAARTVKGHCPLLRKEGNQYHCVGHGSHPFYLGGCVSFPARPEDSAMHPDCSYTWERL